MPIFWAGLVTWNILGKFVKKKLVLIFLSIRRPKFSKSRGENKTEFFRGYLCCGVKKHHPLLADADHTWRWTPSGGHLLSQENVSAKERQGGQNLWKTIDDGKRCHHRYHHHHHHYRHQRYDWEDITHRWILFWFPEEWGNAWQQADPNRRCRSLQCYVWLLPVVAGTPLSPPLKEKKS